MEKMPTYFTADHAVSMTLRDYFAAKTLAGMVSEFKNLTSYQKMVQEGETIAQYIAFDCYAIADAMLKERER